MDQRRIIQDLLRTLRRRAILIAVLGAAGVAAALALALLLPPRYETSARILVEGQQIPDALARSTVTSSAVERLGLIEQRLMARDSVMALIDRLGLYADRPDMSLNDRIFAVRKATRIQSEHPGQGMGGPDGASGAAISITVTYGDPVQAAAIANEFIAALLEQNLAARANQTRETLRFFDAERDRLAEEIGALDREITAYKTENEALLPESLEFRRDEMGRLLESSLEIDRRILTLEDQRGTLRSGLADDDLVARPLSPEATLLRELETDLAQKRLRLAPGHPEIRDLRGRIAAIRDVMGAGTGEATGEAGLSARERSVRRQAEMLDSQIALLEEQRRELGRRRAEIESSLQLTPTVETTLAKLERRRDALLEQYASIIQKRAEAETGERLEASRQAERFEVLESALTPEDPVSPSRRKVFALGAAAALAGAFGLAFLLETLNPAIRTSAEFQRQLQIAPLAAIPHVRTRRERRMRLASLALAGLLAAAALPAGLWAVDRYVRPVQSVIDPAAARSGLEAVIRSVRSRF